MSNNHNIKNKIFTKTNKGTAKLTNAKLADEVYGIIHASNKQKEKIMFNSNMIFEKKECFFILLSSLYLL